MRGRGAGWRTGQRGCAVTGPGARPPVRRRRRSWAASVAANSHRRACSFNGVGRAEGNGHVGLEKWTWVCFQRLPRLLLPCFSWVRRQGKWGSCCRGRVVRARSPLDLSSARIGGRPSCAGACTLRTRLWKCEKRNRDAGGPVGTRARRTRALAFSPSFCCSRARRQGSVLGCRKCLF